MWIIHGNELSDEQQDSIQQLENLLRSGGIGESETVKIHLYANRWVFVKQIKEYGRW
jgi:hypothetical protein